MGTIKQGILGGFSGKVANVVGSSWKGIAVIKAKPLSVANPRTAAQTAQRDKFKNASLFASLILATIIKPLWDRFAQKESGYNAFMRTNIDLFDNALPSPAANLKISLGKMAATAIDSITVLNADANVAVDWSDDSGEGLKLATDLAFAVAVNETQAIVGVSAGGSTRADEALSIVLSANCVTADVVNVYLAFRRADGTVVSDTAFLADTV